MGSGSKDTRAQPLPEKWGLRGSEKGTDQASDGSTGTGLLAPGLVLFRFPCKQNPSFFSLLLQHSSNLLHWIHAVCSVFSAFAMQPQLPVRGVLSVSCPGQPQACTISYGQCGLMVSAWAKVTMLLAKLSPLYQELPSFSHFCLLCQVRSYNPPSLYPYPPQAISGCSLGSERSQG